MSLATLIIASVCTASPTHPELCSGGLPTGVKTEIVAPAGCDTSSWLGNPNGAWTIPPSGCNKEVKVVWKTKADNAVITSRTVDLTHRANEASSVSVSAAM